MGKLQTGDPEGNSLQLAPLGLGHVIAASEVLGLWRAVLGVLAGMLIRAEWENLAAGELGRHGFLVLKCAVRMNFACEIALKCGRQLTREVVKDLRS